MSRISPGDEAVWARVSHAFEVHEAVLRRGLSRLLDSEVDISDVLQRMLVRVVHAADRLPETDAGLRAYMLTVARNLAKDVRRNRASRRRKLRMLAAELEEAHTSEPVPVPQRKLEGRRVVAVVYRALLDLPIRQRIAIWLVDLRGHTIRYAARDLGIQAETLKKRRQRAHQGLRSILEDMHVESHQDACGTIGNEDPEELEARFIASLPAAFRP